MNFLSYVKQYFSSVNKKTLRDEEVATALSELKQNELESMMVNYKTFKIESFINAETVAFANNEFQKIKNPESPEGVAAVNQVFMKLNARLTQDESWQKIWQGRNSPVDQNVQENLLRAHRFAIIGLVHQQQPATKAIGILHEERQTLSRAKKNSTTDTDAGEAMQARIRKINTQTDAYSKQSAIEAKRTKTFQALNLKFKAIAPRKPLSQKPNLNTIKNNIRTKLIKYAEERLGSPFFEILSQATLAQDIIRTLDNIHEAELPKVLIEKIQNAPEIKELLNTELNFLYSMTPPKPVAKVTETPPPQPQKEQLPLSLQQTQKLLQSILQAYIEKQGNEMSKIRDTRKSQTLLSFSGQANAIHSGDSAIQRTEELFATRQFKREIDTMISQNPTEEELKQKLTEQLSNQKLNENLRENLKKELAPVLTTLNITFEKPTAISRPNHDSVKS